MNLKANIFFKECLCTLFCLFYSDFFSQRITIKDSLDKKTIPFCEIFIDDKAYFSDSLGNFEIKDISPETISIKKSGYEKKVISGLSSKPSQIVYLSPQFVSIEEIDLKKKKELIMQPDFKKNNTTLLPAGIDIGFTLSNKSGKDAVIKQLILPIKEIKNNNYYLKVDFYTLPRNTSSKKINGASLFIPVSSLKKRNNIIDMDEKIPFPKEGILISFRIIENIGKYSNKITTPVIVFYNEKNGGNTYFLNNKEIWEKVTMKVPQISLGFVLLQ